MMLRFISARPRAAALALLCLSALGAMGLLWRTSSKTETNFLPHLPPAQWIVGPAAPEVAPRPRVKLETTFKQSFNLATGPAHAELRVAGFHEYVVELNGAIIRLSARKDGNWKEPHSFDVKNLLRSGGNEISVSVSNTNGPAALWLSLSADAFQLSSDESWKASCAGAAWTAARRATLPKPVVAGGPLSGGESIWQNFRALWLTLVVFAVISAVVFWLAMGWARAEAAITDPRRRREWLPPLLLAGLWVVLFINNLGSLPFRGFDADGHLAYISYILDRHALPFANEGWEMFQPPLYYLACAGALKIIGLHTWQDEGIMALRIIGLVIGVANFVIVWACLRLLFPESRARQMWGLLLAAFLPPLLYLSQYITNEPAGVAAVGACVYLTLRILKSRESSLRLYAALGAVLGLALLAKITAALLVPLVIVALVWKAIAQPEISTSRRSAQLFLLFAACLGVCGWHYARVWMHVQNSPGVTWIPNTDIQWWQDDGYRTAAFYLRFGRSFIHPWFSGFHGFPDGVYSTLWGDGLFGGSGDFLLRPPWNYDLMSVGYWLALLPALGVIVGGCIAIAQFLRQPSPEWFLLLGLGFLAVLAVVHLSLTVPYCSVVKAFYGLLALVPACALGAWGLDSIHRRSGRLRPLVCVLFGIWALASFTSFWVLGSARDTTLARSRAFAQSGRTSDAIQTLAAALQWYPQDAELHCLLAEILIPLGQVQDAANHAELAVSQNPNDAQSHLIYSIALTARNQLKAAEAEARKALELAPGNARAWSQLGMLLVRQGLYDEAERLTRKGLAISPYSPDIRLQLGLALLNHGQYPEGMTQLQLASSLKAGASTNSTPDATDLSHPPGNSEPHEVRQKLDAAAFLLRHTSVPEALSLYQAVLEIAPHSAEAHCGLGEALGKQGNLDDAAQHFETALKITPDYAPALVQLGIVRARQGKLDDAFAAISQATRLQPNDAMAHNYLGNVLAQQGRTAEAVAEFENALRLKPDFALAHNNLAVNCKKLGRTADAIAHYREALRWDPDFLDSLNNLAWALATVPDSQFRNGADAIVLAARACELTRYQKPMPLATFAAACAEQGRYRDAIAYAERALQLSGGQGARGAMLPPMLESFRAHTPYRTN